MDHRTVYSRAPTSDPAGPEPYPQDKFDPTCQLGAAETTPGRGTGQHQGGVL